MREAGRNGVSLIPIDRCDAIEGREEYQSHGANNNTCVRRAGFTLV